VQALIAEAPDGEPVGLAHHRPFARPLRASRGLFLDDLFVDQAWRGRGVADALLAALAGVARAEGCDVVRWITAEDNARARAVYDRVARATRWVTYDMPTGG
jgi:GNAT superfamily N-acetyltransferase